LVVLMAGTNDLAVDKPDAKVVFERLQRLHEVCHSRGVPTVALAPPGPLPSAHRAARVQLGATLAEFAQNAAGVVAFADCEELVPRSPRNGGRKLWDPDDIHMNAEGSRLLGQRMLQVVLGALCAGRPSDLRRGSFTLDRSFDGHAAPRPADARNSSFVSDVRNGSFIPEQATWRSASPSAAASFAASQADLSMSVLPPRLSSYVPITEFGGRSEASPSAPRPCGQLRLSTPFCTRSSSALPCNVSTAAEHGTSSVKSARTVSPTHSVHVVKASASSLQSKSSPSPYHDRGFRGTHSTSPVRSTSYSRRHTSVYAM
jgi:hypothetical protein